MQQRGEVATALCFCSWLPYSLYFVPLSYFWFVYCLVSCVLVVVGVFLVCLGFWVLFCFSFCLFAFMGFNNFFFWSCSFQFPPPPAPHILCSCLLVFILAAQLHFCLLPLMFLWCGVISWISPGPVQLITKFILHRNPSQGQIGNSWVGFQLFVAAAEILALKSQDQSKRCAWCILELLYGRKEENQKYLM